MEMAQSCRPMLQARSFRPVRRVQGPGPPKGPVANIVRHIWNTCDHMSYTCISHFCSHDCHMCFLTLSNLNPCTLANLNPCQLTLLSPLLLILEPLHYSTPLILVKRRRRTCGKNTSNIHDLSMVDGGIPCAIEDISLAICPFNFATFFCLVVLQL